MTTISSHPARPAADAVVALPRGRRQTELLMLVFAVGLVLFAYASVGLGLNGKLPAGIATYGLGFAWAAPLMLPLAALLNGLGVVMIYRLQQSGRNGNPGIQVSTIAASATTTQVLYSALGVAAFVLVLVFIKEVKVLQRYTYTLGAAGLVLLAIPALLPSRYSQVPGTGAKIPSWRWPCSSPATWSPSATCWRWPAAGSWASTCPGPVTWDRC